ncbi:MAG TPA: hypothetical protein VE782_02825, partial [Myxococcaceae bacterium]|nr:hypothetical protein [Myxococcaceae bacterium]
ADNDHVNVNVNDHVNEPAAVFEPSCRYPVATDGSTRPSRGIVRRSLTLTWSLTWTATAT